MVGAADSFPEGEAFSLLLCARLAALDHEAVLIVSAVGVNESGLIVGVEEIFLAQSLDFVVDGIQQRLIALADGGGNRVLAAQGRDADSVAGVLAGKRDDLSVLSLAQATPPFSIALLAVA